MKLALHALAVGLLSGWLAAQGLKLNPPLARADLDVEAGRFVLDAAGTRAAYAQGERLFAVATDGSTSAVRLDEAGAAFERILELRLTPDGERLIFRASTLPTHSQELFHVPMDGSAPPARLNHALGASGHVGWGYLNFAAPFALTPDGAHVVYLAYTAPGGAVEFFTVPSDGSAAPRRLHPPLAAGSSVLDFAVGTGGRVAFQVRGPGPFDAILTAPADGLIDAVRIDGDVAGAFLFDFAFTSSGARVVFRASSPGEDSRLYSAPADGSQPRVRLDDLPPGPGYVREYEAASVDRVVYLVLIDSVSGVERLYSVPTDGSAAPVALTGSLSGPSTFQLQATPESVLYSTNAGLFRAPIDGTSAPVQLSTGASNGYALTPDGSRVVFSKYLSLVGDRLYSAPSDGSAAPVLLNAPAPPGPSLRFALTPDSARVVYLQQVDQGGLLQALFSVPVAGASAPVRLDACVAPTRSVLEFQLGASGVVYVADERLDESFELFRAPADGSAPSQRLGKTLFGERVGDVVAYTLSHDGARAAYLADVQRDGSFELASVALRQPGPSVPLHPPLSDLGEVLDGFAFSGDDQWIVFRQLLGPTGEVELFATAAAGGPAHQLDLGDAAGMDVSAFALPGPSAWPQYRGRVAFAAAGGGAEVGGLFSSELPGSPVRLATANVTRLEFDPTGARVVYLGSEGGGNFLWSVPIDGGTPAQRVDWPGTPANRVRDFRITSDGSEVVWAADAEYPGVIELYASTIEGVPVRKLSQVPYPSPGVVDFELAPRASSDVRVVYSVYPEAGHGAVLYSVAISAGVPQRLDTVAAPASAVTDFRIHPSGFQVVFRADAVTDEVFELWWVPIDGSAPPARLHAPLDGGRDVEGDFVALAGGGALFRGDLAQNGKLELFHTAFDGSPARRLNAPLAGSAKVRAFVTGPPLGPAFYLADTAPGGGQELFETPVFGTWPVRRRSGQLVGRGSVVDARPSSNGSYLLYLADEDEDDVFELYRVYLGIVPDVRRR